MIMGRQLIDNIILSCKQKPKESCYTTILVIQPQSRGIIKHMKAGAMQWTVRGRKTVVYLLCIILPALVSLSRFVLQVFEIQETNLYCLKKDNARSSINITMRRRV